MAGKKGKSGGERAGAGGPKKYNEKTKNICKQVRASIADDVRKVLNDYVKQRDEEAKK